MSDESVVYRITYSGDKLPPYYIGSVYKRVYDKGYYGSPASKRWAKIHADELRCNPHLFSREILSVHATRREALEEELRVQRELDVVNNPLYFNESYATPNGFFGNAELSRYNALGKHNCRGRVWANDGIRSYMVYEITDGLMPGRCEYDKKKISVRTRGKRDWIWICNSADECVRIHKDEPIPDGWRKGRPSKIGKICAAGRTRRFKWYRSPDNSHEIRVYEDETVPEGYIKGRKLGKR